MKVILLESTNGVGMVGDVVNVKPGFARNYLIPSKKAVIADQGNVKVFEHQKRMMEKRVLKAKAAAEGNRGKIHNQEVTLIRKTAKANKLFGSVTALDLQKAILEQLDVEVNRKGIVLVDPIRQVGEFSINVKLDGGVEATLKVVVQKDVNSEEELAPTFKEEKVEEAAEEVKTEEPSLT